MAICCLCGPRQEFDFSGLEAVQLKTGNEDNRVRRWNVPEQPRSAGMVSLFSPIGYTKLLRTPWWLLKGILEM